MTANIDRQIIVDRKARTAIRGTALQGNSCRERLSNHRTRGSRISAGFFLPMYVGIPNAVTQTLDQSAVEVFEFASCIPLIYFLAYIPQQGRMA